MNKILVLFDMDGFSSDWQGYIMKKHFEDLDVSWLNRHPHRDMLVADVYEKELDLFYKLPVIDGFKTFFSKFMEDIHPKLNITHEWLSAIGKSFPNEHYCRLSKQEWLEDKIYTEVQHSPILRMVSESKDKKGYIFHLLTSGDYEKIILIDDFKRTCDEVNSLERTVGIHFTGCYDEVLTKLKHEIQLTE